MNAALPNVNLSNTDTLENANALAVTSPSQVQSTEGNRPAGKRRESLLDILMRALSAVAF